jgi:hypothetical protein
VRPHCAAVYQMAWPELVDVFNGPCQLAISCQVACQLEPDKCRSASKEAVPFLKRVGSKDVPIGLRRLSRSSLVYILRLNAISYVDAVNFQRSQLPLCMVGLANWHTAA